MKTSTRAAIAATIAASLLFTAPGVAFAASTPPPAVASQHVRGQLLDVTYLATYTDPASVLKNAGFQDPGTLRHGVVTYRIVYRTVDPSGRPTTASGLVALPLGKRGDLKVVSYTHGTELYWQNAPSAYLESGDLWSAAPAITYAGTGFAAVAPDYLGLGYGQPMTQAYLHIPSEVTTSVDMLRAARTFAQRRGIELRRHVLVTGFSQGGMAAVGLARGLQDGADGWFRLGALSAVSGAYDTTTELPAFLDGTVNERLAVVYTAVLLVTWNKLHHLYDSPYEVFQPKYAGQMDRLFNSRTPVDEILRTLPTTLGELYTEAGLAMLRHPTGRFAAALAEADSICRDWTPRVPVRLLYSTLDREAVPANTMSCAASFAARGFRAPVTDLPPLAYNESYHLGTNVTGLAETARWFNQLR
ncbi:lipase family protein [Fodinicola acaciae]|uniref:lipase family protein n=1 Tax=Fodinicola acaciae TaxID=2681555 RepID=UPI001C9E3B5F|nr:lipase family protein [Fodinicola acaciae]